MEKVWLAQYQHGIPAEIDPNQYQSLVEIFEEACRLYADKVAFVSMGAELTYKKLEEMTLQFAHFLRNLGLKRGARVALMMPNILQYPVALFGALRAGFVIVNTNPLYTADEVTHQLNDAQAEAIVVLANFAYTVEKALPHLETTKHIIVTELGDLFTPWKRKIVNAVVKYVKKMVPVYTLPKALSFLDAFVPENNKPLASADLTHQDLAFLQYTGGTTGVSKGAMLSHGNMVANVLQAQAWISGVVSHDETVVTPLPLYHIFSLLANCITFIHLGAKNILIVNPRDISQFIKEIKNTKFSIITGVNTLYNALLAHPQFKKVDFSALKMALAGGIALHKSVAMKWLEVTGKPLLEAYGLTETCPAVAINPMHLTEFNGSVGLPLSSTEISVRDEEGQEVGFNVPGELCVKGPQVMVGYWLKPEETENVMTCDGFLKTGDIVRVDEKGFVYIVDRKKDMINVSGFNVYPNEVEQVLSMHPSVLEVGVVGIPTEGGSELVKAFVVQRNSGLTAAELIEYCRHHLTAYKVPKEIEFCRELPKTNVGKILRRALKDNYQSKSTNNGVQK